jgi:general secretion pathway protein C
MQTLEPGDEETVVMNCPFVEGATVTTLSEASFRIKRSSSTKQAVDPDPLRPTPYFVNGEIRGYRVYPGSDRSAFASLGLRPGDLVTEIDGQPLTDSAVALELFEKALSGQPVQFSVRRGDEPMMIDIKVNRPGFPGDSIL